MRLARILFPTDFSRCAEQAFAWAARIAADRQAELHVLHVSRLLSYPDAESEGWEERFAPLYREREEQAAKRLADLSSRADTADGPTIETATRRGTSVAPEILAYIRDTSIDLTVMGTHGRRGIEHLILGGVAEEVLRRASCPVLTVREQEQPLPIEAIEKILVPIDLSEHSGAALAAAKEMAALYHAELQLLHVVEAPVYPSFYALDRESFRALVGDVENEARLKLRQLAADTEGPAVPFEAFVVDGAPAAAILDFLSAKGADMMVVPTHGQTNLKRFFLGSVSEKIVRRAPVPVLTVRRRSEV